MAVAPVEERVSTASSTPGVLGTSGVESLRRTLRSADTAKPFVQWSSEPFTRLVRRAIRSLALSGTRPEVQNPEVAYGVTCGLQLAAQLMEDPSAVFNDVFSSGSGVSRKVDLDQLQETFSTAPDEI